MPYTLAIVELTLALALALSLAISVALPVARAAAIPAQARGLARCNDLPGVNRSRAYAVAAGLRLKVGLAARRPSLHLNLNALPHDAINVRTYRTTGGLCASAGLL